MIWIALLGSVLATPPVSGGCAEIDPHYLDRQESSRAPVLNVVLHVDGGILSIPWVGKPTVRQWNEPFENGTAIEVPSQLDYGLEDGRLVARLHGYRDKLERFEVWSWDGHVRITKVGAAASQRRLAAMLCRAQAATDENSHAPVGEWFCVGGRLIANDNDDRVLVWEEQRRWVPVGATLSLSSIGDLSNTRLLLRPEDYSRVNVAFTRFSIPMAKVPATGPLGDGGTGGSSTSQLQAVSCGSRACWAINRAGAVLVHDTITPDFPWRTIGQLGDANAQISLSAASDRAVLTLANCADQLFYMTFPNGP